MSRILLVDDDPAVRAVVVRVLSRLSHDVVAFGSAEDALATLTVRAPFDLVICDLHLENMDGLGFYDQLRARGMTARFILASGLLGTNIELERPLPPDVYFLEKPFEMEDLLGAVRRVLAA